MSERTITARTVGAAFRKIVAGIVDIDLGTSSRELKLDHFADSNYPASYVTRSPAWDYELEWRKQVVYLQWHFPSLRGLGLGFDREFAAAITINRSRVIVPSHMERWILLPAAWCHFGVGYKAACLSVLSILKETYPERDVVWSTLEAVKEHRLLPNPATEQALHRAALQQNHRGLLLVPIQVGRCYAGRSVLDVLRGLTDSGGREAGLGIIETALFLLYYPGRLGAGYRGLWINAPGSLITESGQLQTPYFRMNASGILEIGCSPVTEGDLHSGVATLYV